MLKTIDDYISETVAMSFYDIKGNSDSEGEALHPGCSSIRDTAQQFYWPSLFNLLPTTFLLMLSR